MSLLHSNRLAEETSPYLLQHANNPVDWYPWGEEALSLAKSQKKPILVSIGYAACHWCHVMERESFEDEAVADFMNKAFVNIKIDREERPDLDHIYMDAIQTLTGSGGWPLNVFLTPEGQPFYGGTYFPPSAAFNRPSWMDVLQGVDNAWRDREPAIRQQAADLTRHLQTSNQIGSSPPENLVNNDLNIVPLSEYNLETLTVITREILKNADTKEGGFGRAPKFPQTQALTCLLEFGHLNQDQKVIDSALFSIKKMICGGIFDQIGGGFARYSTDNEWLVPHFEKMLYDQALLIGLLADAFCLSSDPLFEEAIHLSMEFIRREMLSPEGGFYAALDADSEGEEGKFYVWEKGEIENILGEDAGLAITWFGVTEEGNWEGINILTRPIEPEMVLQSMDISASEWKVKLAEIRQKMLVARAARIRPGLDDKLLLSWNALMNTACSKAFQATGNETYRELAIRNMNWLLKAFERADGGFYHSFKASRAKFPAFLDDYAYLVQALIYIQEITGDQSYLERAKTLTERIIADFGEEGNQLFYYTFSQQNDLVVRKREVYDGAQPSGNAVMVLNLYYLALVLDRPDWRDKALKMLETMAKAVVRYPLSFGNWAQALARVVHGLVEIAVVGPEVDALRSKINAIFIPFKVLQSATHENNAYPLLRQKLSEPDTLIYVCHNYACQQPVLTVNELLAILKGKTPKLLN